MDKTQLRKLFKKQRNTLSAKQHAEASRLICEALLQTLNPKIHRVILSFYPFGREPNIAPFLDSFRHQVTVALPRTLEGGVLEFVPWTSQTTFFTDSFGIRTPEGDAMAIEDDFLVITPALAIDREGFRLGYGGGFYDRFFQKYPNLERWGITFSTGLTDKLPRESWDLPMHQWLSEKGWQTRT